MILPLEKQVCSLDLARRLKELGAPQESLFYHYFNAGKPTGVIVQGYENASDDFRSSKLVAAYTVAELGELLPTNTWAFLIEKTPREEVRLLMLGGQKLDFPLHNVFAETEADARAKLLIYLLEQKLITL